MGSMVVAEVFGQPLDGIDKDGFGAYATFGSSFASLRRHKVGPPLATQLKLQ